MITLRKALLDSSRRRWLPGNWSRLAVLGLSAWLVGCSETAPAPARASASASPGCSVDPAGLHKARVKVVVDGDTLHLADGEKVRMIGINAPERGRDGSADQPLAITASRELKSLVRPGGHVLLQYGRDSRDRYGRRLAHVFTTDGDNVQAALLRTGLAFHVAVAPNFAHMECLRSAESFARDRGVGVWSESVYEALAVEQLAEGQGGFARVRGEVTRVSFKDNGWWVQLDGRLGLQIKRESQALFDRTALQELRAREIEARGWLVPMKGGWWMMSVGHPQMIDDNPSGR